MSADQLDRYQIKVKGKLDPKLSTWFEDFAISYTHDGNTLLIGTVVDQAALHGVLTRCRDLGVTLISANPVSEVSNQTNRQSQEFRMNTFHVEQSKVINARPDAVHAIIADYRHAHKAILPKQFFTELTVEKGGQGAGTVVLGKMKVYGKEYTFHQAVTEPEPGHVLVETDIDTGQYTTFTFEPLNGGNQTRLTIASEFPRKRGLMGLLEAMMQPSVVGNIYKQELKILATYVSEQKMVVGAR